MIIEKLSREVGLSTAALRKYVRTASHRYKTYAVAKKKGGTRIIHHPARSLKFLQRWAVKELEGLIPIHPSATAYHVGASINANAARHASNNFILRVDFREFFPSIKGRDVALLLSKARQGAQVVFDEDDIDTIVSIVCRHGELTIGAPSSPFLSNAIMYDFDKHWTARATSLHCAYSRYADDLYFSTVRRDVLAGLLEEVRVHLREMPYPNLFINESKLVFTSRKRRRLVTGLILTPQGNLSIGHDRKRYIRSLVHKGITGKLDPSELGRLRGLLSYVKSAEPTFVESLNRKFGEEMVRNLG